MHCADVQVKVLARWRGRRYEGLVKLPTAPAVLVAVVLGSSLAFAAPSKKKDPKPAPARSAWSLPVARPTPEILPVSLRGAAVPARREDGARERTITAPLKIGDAREERAVRLALGPETDGIVHHAHVELRAGDVVVQSTPVPVDGSPAAVLASFELVDLDFDGWLDVRVLRERGAKWGAYTVRMFHPESGRFVENEAARKMSGLPNLDVDRDARLVVSRTIGPADPTYAAFRVEGGDLVLVRHCVFKTELGAGAVGTLVVKEGGRERRFDRVALPAGFPDRCEPGR